VGEFDLIRQFFVRQQDVDAGFAGDFNHLNGKSPGARLSLGIGDDCALIDLVQPARLAISTDMLVEGRHFFVGTPPAAIAHKALAVNLSDLAAMGARPLAFTLALAMPSADVPFLEEFSAGLFAIADRFKCRLIGGDTTRGPLNICITVFGELSPEQSLLRSAAQAGDDVWVSGTLGAAGFAVQRKEQLAPNHPALKALRWPEPRIELGRRLLELTDPTNGELVVSSAIDLSDGLVGDVAHIARASKVEVCLEAHLIPCASCIDHLEPFEQLRLAIAAGDDYELAFTAKPQCRHLLEALSISLQLPLTRVGRCLPVQPQTFGVRPVVNVVNFNGQLLSPEQLAMLVSYEHF
jgi:thiamine-monophosphate kinase